MREFINLSIIVAETDFLWTYCAIINLKNYLTVSEGILSAVNQPKNQYS
jgi:hypothetical protein